MTDSMHSGERRSLGACGIVSIVICTIIYSLIQLIIPVANIVVGVQYLNDCKYEPMIPVWLAVQGGLAIYVILVSNVLVVLIGFYGVKGLLIRVKGMAGFNGPTKGLAVLCSLFALFSVLVALFTAVWFIIGNVWVFSVHSTANVTDSSSHDYCNPVVHWYSFISIIVTYGLIVLTCCGSICYSGCFALRNQISD